MAFSISIQSPFSPSSQILENSCKNEFSPKFKSGKISKKFRNCRAMAAQPQLQGPSSAYAKEIERLSAKESLLIAFKDAGGFEALVTGKMKNLQSIDVNERIVSLERLNPSPRPTTSPYLEGKWNFEWFGSGSSGLVAARSLFERFPPELANLSRLDVVIKDSYAKNSASLKFLNSIDSKFVISSKLTVEGPLRMKQEFLEGLLESPNVNEESIPQQLRGAFAQVTSAVQQLPVLMRDVASGGIKVPLGGSLERFFMISYLDDEILIIRDAGGVPEVLTRLDPGPSPLAEPTTEYES